MKKILFASTALIATASVAAAELTWSGSGRFGMVHNSGNAGGADPKTRLDHRFRLTVNGVTETDGGVKFEGRIRFEANDGTASSVGVNTAGTAPTINAGSANGAGAASVGAAGFAVTAGGFRVDVGHVSDVFDSGDVVSWGPIGMGYTSFLDQAANFDSFTKSGFGAGSRSNNTIKARYQGGNFTGSISYQMKTAGAANNNDSIQAGIGYNFGAHRIGAMYGQMNGATKVKQWALGANGSFGDFTYAVLVGDNDTQNKTSFGASGSYAVSAATSLKAFVSTGGTSGNKTSYGIGANHSLGGGVSLGAGVGKNSAGNTQGDLGVNFSF